MSFTAELNLEGKVYALRHFVWAVSQNVDAVGRPDTRVSGGQLQLEIDSQPDEQLHHWALDDTKKMSGNLVVYHSDARSVRKTIAFEDAYCVAMRKDFDSSTNSQNMTMTLHLSASRLTVGSVTIDNQWPQ
ncbi:type VI secretion system tube protein TssD [Hymenobacter cavernae]|uniref:Type VI secretion system needle protein Hcp n=1 Tax=Hymenobacter cavernae TaxID=2044852 RepID=A0ABQ1UWE5_9BACT|nr:type VI secretion system tube protein TssD [Hymenobacter cavernae]GGF26745.1 hypothetical protein GCM10011383_42850 [Hymenobacter cavernae]